MSTEGLLLNQGYRGKGAGFICRVPAGFLALWVILPNEDWTMRNRDAELQAKIGAIRERIQEGLKKLPTHDHLRHLPVEFEPVDYQTLLVLISGSEFFSDADIAALKEILGGCQACEVSRDRENKVSIRFTLSV